MSQRITIEIKNKIATCLTELPIVCGNSDYLIDFVFDEEWAEHDVKTAVFVANGKSTEQVFNGTVCPVPVFSNTLIAWVGVFVGTINDGTLSTSTPALVKCIPCITDGDKVPMAPPDDVYNQIIALINKYIEQGGGGEGGLTEQQVGEIVDKKTAELQPKIDDSLDTDSQEVVGAINELHSEISDIKVTYPIEIGAGLEEDDGTLKISLLNSDGNLLSDASVDLSSLGGEIPDLSEYVKNTDYISSNKAGILADSSYYGLRAITDKGVVGGISRALDKYNTDSPYYFISKGTLENIKYEYIKQGITTNTETWTDDEMQSARDLIGAVGKGDKAGLNILGLVMGSNTYCSQVNSSGTLLCRQLSLAEYEKATDASFMAKGTLENIKYDYVMRALSEYQVAEGETSLWTDDSTVDGQVVKGTKTKACETIGAVKQIQYVSGNTATITGTDRGIVGRAYVKDFNNKDNSIAISPQSKSDTLASRDSTGNMQVADPKLDYHCANRRYVHNLPNNLTLTDDEKAKWRGMIGASKKFYLHTMKGVSLIDYSPTPKTPEEMVLALESNTSFERRFSIYGASIICASTRNTMSFPTQIAIHFYNDAMNDFENRVIDFADQTDTVTEL